LTVPRFRPFQNGPSAPTNPEAPATFGDLLDLRNIEL